MKAVVSASVAFILSGIITLSASSRIGDPVTFVSGVYRNFVEAESTNHSYTPPEDIYTARLANLFRQDKRRAKGEVGCLDFVFWVNGQDWTLTNISVTAGVTGADRKTVVAKFRNIGMPQEIHFDFLRVEGRWLLDDAHSVKDPRWTLSEILKCPL